MANKEGTIKKGDLIWYTANMDTIGKRGSQPVVFAKGMVTEVDNKGRKFHVTWHIESYPDIEKLISKEFTVVRMEPGKAILKNGEVYLHESTKVDLWVIYIKNPEARMDTTAAVKRLNNYVESCFPTYSPDYVDNLADSRYFSIPFSKEVESNVGKIRVVKLSLEYRDNVKNPVGVLFVYFDTRTTVAEPKEFIGDKKLLKSIKASLKELGFTSTDIGYMEVHKDKTQCVPSFNFVTFGVSPEFVGEWFDVLGSKK